MVQSSTCIVWTPGALDEGDIRAIAHEHAGTLGMFIDAPPTEDRSPTGLAMVGMQMLLGDPAIYDSIVAAGCKRNRADTAALAPLRKSVLGLRIIQMTAEKFDTASLWRIIGPEITPYSELMMAAGQ